MSSRVSPSFFTYLKVEAIRLKASPVLYFSLIGMLFAALSLTLSVGAQTAGFQSAPYSWQVMYFTGMAAPLMMVLAGMSEQREHRARNGGIAWRGASPAQDRVARLFGLAFVSALFQVLSFGGVIALGGPLRAGVTAAVFAWIGSLGMLGLGSIIARKMGIIAALVCGVVWQVLGGIGVEKTWWWLFPPAWPIRIMLVPIGVQFNGTPMPVDHPALEEHPLFGASLCAVFGAVMFLLASRVNERQQDRKRKNIRAQASTVTVPFEITQRAVAGVGEFRKPRRLPIAAVVLSLKGSGVAICMFLTVIVLMVCAGTYSIDIVTGLFSFVVLPLGVAVLPVLVWRISEDSYAQLHTENPRFTPALVAVQVLILGCIVAFVAVCSIMAGAEISSILSKCALWMLVGTTLLFIEFMLVVRFGAGAAFSAMVFMMIVAVTLGGDVLAETFLWVVAFPVWAEIATTPQRLLIALAVSSTSCLCTAYLLARVLQVRRRA